MTGQTIGHYQVREKLGEGGSAVVYRAEDLALRREVVLKFLSADCADYGNIARFQHEARTASSLNHPNICTIYEVGEHEGRHFLAMELLEGQVLSRMIAGRPLDAYQIVEIGAQIAEALEAAHAEGIVHRDLKPANIFITKRGHVKLLDFGLAVLLPKRAALRSATVSLMTSSTGGTVPYMSPEQARAEALDPRTDLFSFGVVLYEMTTGTRPFIGATPAEVMDAILAHAPAPVRQLNPAAPGELERIIDKALEKQPRLRFQTASDIRADLQRLKRDLDSAMRTQAAGPAAPSRRRPAWLLGGRIAATAGGVVIAGAAIFAASFVRNRATRINAPDPIPAVRRADAAVSLSDIPRSGGVVRDPDADPPPTPAPSPETARPSAPPPPPEAVEPAPTRPEPEPVVAPAEPDAEHERARADLRVARQKIELKLYDQAIGTLQRVAASSSRADAIQAWFLIGSIHDMRGGAEDAMSTYLEIANRFADDARAPEALMHLAEATLRSKRKDNDVDARRTLTELAQKYAASSWAPRALLLRADIEERRGLYQRDDMLGGSVPSAAVTYREVINRYATSGAAETAMSRLARLYSDAKRYDLAATTYEQLAARDEENRYDAWFAAGELYEKRLKDERRARSAYTRVPSSSPRFADAQKRLRK